MNSRTWGLLADTSAAVAVAGAWSIVDGWRAWVLTGLIFATNFASYVQGQEKVNEWSSER